MERLASSGCLDSLARKKKGDRYVKEYMKGVYGGPTPGPWKEDQFCEAEDRLFEIVHLSRHLIAR